MKYHTPFMQSIVENAGVPAVKTLAAQPGCQGIWRIVVYYARGQARASVATLHQARGSAAARLEVVYAGFRDHRPLCYPIPAERVAALLLAGQQAGFDTLPDGREPAGLFRTLWLVERAAGSFYRAVMLSPHEPVMPYSRLINAIDACIPEAIREMPLP
ncbi:MAG: hypothetical protein MUE40_03255 [Anaerolineae bacterium]|jgi:hypothetical protein|nr:hypothetical protein [Anaerolineae bacterium]